MAVSVRILNKVVDEQNNEYKAAVALKEMFEKSFQEKTNGSIHIAYGLTLCGQEVRDVDLFVFGKLDNYILPNYYANSPQYPKKPLVVDGFCIAIELKEHPFAKISLDNTHVLVEYNGSWKDATEQNEKQRYSCARYFSNAFGYDCYITNFLWLKSISPEQYKTLLYGNRIGALPAVFTFKDVIDVVIAQGMNPHFNNLDKCYHICPNSDNNYFDDIKNLLSLNSHRTIGELTRKKLELLSQQNTIRTLSNSSVGECLTIFKGRAGTGKTFRLVQSALQLANPDTGQRCLLLTYNHALVSDIRRLLHYMEIPDGIDTYTVQIKTLHSFFIDLMKTLGINTKQIYGSHFENAYNKSIDELAEYVTDLMDDNDLKVLKDDHKLAIDWDYILVDEAQDWSEQEKQILFKVYGEDHIVVADGVDQFIRSNKRLLWGSKKSQVEEQEFGLRQKTNLVNFVNTLAYELGISWRLKPSKDKNWCGGQVIIAKNYTKGMHDDLVRLCQDAKCENYDMLFLVPPGMVSYSEGGTSHFKNLDLWKKNGIQVFDGTNTSKRHQYATNVEECRLYQYDSCRGLEGWVTICIEFDELIKYKMKQAESMQFAESLALESKKEQIKKFVYQWALMPLTRPIDTLVITLKDPDSEIGQCLHKITNRCPDYVTWKI